ncbi:MAG: PhzF family phenazine biosynthesis protein, partial [Myxococcota bacterium]
MTIASGPSRSASAWLQRSQSPQIPRPVRSEEADRGVRCFTPEGERPAGAHATVAVHHHLFERAKIDDGGHTVELDGVVRDVEVDIDGETYAVDVKVAT